MGKIEHVPVGEDLDSVEWKGKETHRVVGGGEIVVSQPPDGSKLIKSIHHDEEAKEIVLET